MKKNIATIFVSGLSLLMSAINMASHCVHVYTIGAYDDAFAKHAVITKLGPIAADAITAAIPRSFLEKDGSYGGGEAFCDIKQACDALKKQIASAVFSKNEHWHIYLLQADWQKDVYKLQNNDFRLKHSVKVLKRVKKDCLDE